MSGVVSDCRDAVQSGIGGTRDLPASGRQGIRAPARNLEDSRYFARVDVTKNPVPVLPTLCYDVGGIPTNWNTLVVKTRGDEQLSQASWRLVKQSVLRSMGQTASAQTCLSILLRLAPQLN